MIGERLRVARARKNLALADLARECGCSAQAVMKWEKDICMPDSTKFVKLCEVLDASPEWMMDANPLDFRSTDLAPQGRHAKYWVREAIAELRELGLMSGRGSA